MKIENKSGFFQSCDKGWIRGDCITSFIIIDLEAEMNFCMIQFTYHFGNKKYDWDFFPPKYESYEEAENEIKEMLGIIEEYSKRYSYYG